MHFARAQTPSSLPCKIDLCGTLLKQKVRARSENHFNHLPAHCSANLPYITCPPRNQARSYRATPNAPAAPERTPPPAASSAAPLPPISPGCHACASASMSANRPRKATLGARTAARPALRKLLDRMLRQRYALEDPAKRLRRRNRPPAERSSTVAGSGTQAKSSKYMAVWSERKTILRRVKQSVLP